VSDVFHRGAPDVTPEEQRRIDAEARQRAQAWLEATDRLAANGDFSTWLYGVMDDLGLFDREEAPVGEFGQGFRAAANRIRNRMLEAPKAVQLFTDLTKRHHAELHRRLVADRKKHQTEK
jgi:hypothetical protein